MRQYWHFNVKERRLNLRAEERFVSFVVGMRNERNAGWEKLWTGCVNEHVAATVNAMKGEAMIGAGLITIFKFSLSYCGSKGHVPKRWCHGLIGFTALKISQERKLRTNNRFIANSSVGLCPIN
jgi:hypothetical protein